MKPKNNRYIIYWRHGSAEEESRVKSIHDYEINYPQFKLGHMVYSMDKIRKIKRNGVVIWKRSDEE